MPNNKALGQILGALGDKAAERRDGHVTGHRAEEWSPAKSMFSGESTSYELSVGGVSEENDKERVIRTKMSGVGIGVGGLIALHKGRSPDMRRWE